MIAYHMKQASDSWWEARRGMPTASGFDCIISDRGSKLHKERTHPTKKTASVKERLDCTCPKCGAEPGKGCNPYELKADGSSSYISELIEQWVTLNPNYFQDKDTISRSRETQHGRDTEPEARQWLAMYLDKPVTTIGFITNDEGTLGCSPDAVVGEGIKEGGEIKCPSERVQDQRLLTPNVMPREHLPQVHGGMVVTGLKVWHYLSYCPGMDPLYVRVEWNDYTDKLKAVLGEFLKMYHERLEVRFPGFKIVRACRDWLNTDPGLDEFNHNLSLFAEYDETVKTRLRTLVMSHAARAGLKFDAGTKRYFVPQQPSEAYF